VYVIDFVNNKIAIFILNSYCETSNSKLEEERDFSSQVSFLKFIDFHWDSETKSWITSPNRLDEVLLWFTKRGYEYTISDELVNFINEHKLKYTCETSFFRKKCIDYSVLNKNESLFDYQKDGCDWRIKRSNYLDTDDAGLGKTSSNILVFSTLYKNKEIDGILIIPPNGLSYHWKYEILKFSNQFQEDDILIIDKKSKIKPFSNHNKKIIIIPNHLVAICLLSYDKRYSTVKSIKRIRWTNIVDIKKEWGKENLFCLIDESHAIKHSTAVRTKAVLSMKNQFNFRCCLSATPAINRIEDFYNQVSFVDNSIIPMSEKAFILWIAKELGTKFDKYFITEYNEENIKTFYRNLQPHILRRLKEDVPEMRTKKILKNTNLELNLLQRQIYRYVCDKEIFLLEEEFNEITFKLVLNKLQMIIEAIDNPLLLKRRSYYDENLKRLIEKYEIEKDSKFIAFSFLIDKYVNYLGGKAVVYGIHPETLDLLFEKFKKYKPLIIHGKINTKEKERQEIQDKFNNSDENKIIFLSALTSSAGINLQKKCNNIIFYELPFDTVLTRQALDRTARINSTKDSIIDFLVYPETIDNIRYLRSMNRIELNDKLNKELSEEELRKLLKGII
jgi:SNF2 family DNA or RNA helicase